MEKQIDRFLLDYFDKNLKKGYKLEDLRIILIKQGYLRSDIEKRKQKKQKKRD